MVGTWRFRSRVSCQEEGNSEKHMALKVVLSNEIPLLAMEMSIMLSAAPYCSCVMPVAEEQMRVMDNSELSCDFGEMGGGMILLHVGEPVDRERYEEVIHLLVLLD